MLLSLINLYLFFIFCKVIDDVDIGILVIFFISLFLYWLLKDGIDIFSYILKWKEIMLFVKYIWMK